MRFKFQPVVWLTAIALVIGTALQIDAEYHLLPDNWVKWLVRAAGIIAVLITAVKTWGSVTPLAAPRDEAGTRLVPVSSRR